MKVLLLLTAFLFSGHALAKSTVVAVWVESRGEGQSLLIKIVDDPSSAPFLAGSIWQAIKVGATVKKIKTANFNLTCAGQNSPLGEAFGECEIEVPETKVIKQPGFFHVGFGREEGREILDAFNENLYPYIRIGERNEFLFEVNWQSAVVAFILDPKLVQQ